MENHREFSFPSFPSFPSADGVHTVHTVLWPAVGETRAVVQIIHGISEYIERYADFAAFLNEHGYAVAGHDHLGHGHTAKGPEEFGCFPAKNGWMTVSQDVRTLREMVGERYPGVPYFMLGHSMGSFQARTYLIRWPGTVDGCILSGTGQEKAPVIAAGKAAAGVIGRICGPDHVSKTVTAMYLGSYNKKFAPNRTSADWISRDAEIVDAYVADPMCQFVPSVGMFRAMMGGLQYIAKPENLRQMDTRTPVGFFSGASDPVGSMGAGVEKVYQMFQDVGCTDLSKKLYPGARHEILNEINRREVYADMLNWLEGHLPQKSN